VFDITDDDKQVNVPVATTNATDLPSKRYATVNSVKSHLRFRYQTPKCLHCRLTVEAEGVRYTQQACMHMQKLI
jgi:hypothetical protein